MAARGVATTRSSTPPLPGRSPRVPNNFKTSSVISRNRWARCRAQYPTCETRSEPSRSGRSAPSSVTSSRRRRASPIRCHARSPPLEATPRERAEAGGRTESSRGRAWTSPTRRPCEPRRGARLRSNGGVTMGLASNGAGRCSSVDRSEADRRLDPNTVSTDPSRRGCEMARVTLANDPVGVSTRRGVTVIIKIAYASSRPSARDLSSVRSLVYSHRATKTVRGIPVVATARASLRDAR